MLTPQVDQVAGALAPRPLVEALRTAFKENAQEDGPKVEVPLRAHHVIQALSGKPEDDTHLLMMPAWVQGEFIGIKLVGVNAGNPGRAENPQPMVQGIYLLLQAETGAPVALFDAQELTFRRTTAVSALAADYLARKDATILGVIGAGAAMAPYLVEVYRSVRAIKEVCLWNRTASKVDELAKSLAAEGVDVRIAQHPDDVCKSVDIVASCTPSDTPLIRGELLRPGTHVDCIGGFRPTMREADDDVLRRASIFGDTREGVFQEAGDIMLPLAAGVIEAKDFRGDLFDLCGGKVAGRKDDQEITFFKSVGSAVSDLAGAKLVYQALS